jgi:tetratricopeptide (TPR) repeat protein
MRKILAAAALTLTLIIALTSCQPSPAERHACALMDEAEKLIETQPADALQLLDSIDAKAITSKENAARHALLLSMALDKNYIDTTSLAVIQPAADYYLQHGTPKQRLRTYYYQGRIYQNRNDEENAMFAFINAAKADPAITDTLTYARTLVAQGVIYYSRADIDNFIANNLAAAKLYEGVDGNELQDAMCLARALSGCVITEDKQMADSLATLCQQLAEKVEHAGAYVEPSLLMYVIYLGSTEQVIALLSAVNAEDISDDMKLNVANAYARIGDYQTAKRYISNATPPAGEVEQLKYYATKADILQGAGDANSAYEAFRQYSHLLESIHQESFMHDLEFAEQRYEADITRIKAIDRRNEIIYICILGALILLLLTLSLWQKRKLAERERDNLRLELAQLADESESLRDLLNQQTPETQPLESVIKERLEMLNSLLAAEISENETYSKPYKQWIAQLSADKQQFMDSTRKAFTASHPEFIAYLQQHELTIAEINYVCLYAIGLKGKEVGAYIQLKRHYHISSDIRKKLGIDEHETNIGIYIRRLMKTL